MLKKVELFKLKIVKEAMTSAQKETQMNILESLRKNPAAITEADKINVELVGWIQKFLYPYSLDPAAFKHSDVAVQGGLSIG